MNEIVNLAQSQLHTPKKTNTVSSISLGEFYREFNATGISKVVENTNGYKAIVIHKGVDALWIYFGKKSTDKISIGDNPQKDWRVTSVVTSKGEQRLKLFTSNNIEEVW